nr:lysosome-associated membrane glycoprotein 3 [Solea senegalensis]
MLKGLDGKPCIKVTMGAEFIITEKTTWYFSVDPSRISTSGQCDKDAAVLSLNLTDNAGKLQLTFRKEKQVHYITKLTAHLSPLPVCQRCANKTYSGLLDNGRLFTTANGQIFTCKSGTLLLMSPELRLKLVPLKIQAFTPPRGLSGEDVECLADFNNRVVPIVLGATAVGLMLMLGLTLLLIKDRRRNGYNSL